MKKACTEYGSILMHINLSVLFIWKLHVSTWIACVYIGYIQYICIQKLCYLAEPSPHWEMCMCAFVCAFVSVALVYSWCGAGCCKGSVKPWFCTANALQTLSHRLCLSRRFRFGLGQKLIVYKKETVQNRSQAKPLSFDSECTLKGY